MISSQTSPCTEDLTAGGYAIFLFPQDSGHIPAKAVIRDVCFEVFGHDPAEFDGMDQVPVQYAAPSGIFLVLRDDDAIVGTGAIRRIDDQTCELKRPVFPSSRLGILWSANVITSSAG